MTDRPLPYSWAEVRALLQRDLGALLHRLQLSGRSDGARLYPLNPTRDDRRAGSFVIWLRGEGPGGWKDYATGEKGDVIDLIGYVEGLAEKIDAYWWALRFLGLERGVIRTKAADLADRERRERDRIAAENKAAALLAAKSATLFKRWLTLPEIAGTVGETYLREARRIPLDRLRAMPGAIRFSPAEDHHDDETGEVTTWPCLMTAMTRGSKFAALHRTWILPDGSGKAPVDPPKKMIGPVKGSAIRLSGGPKGLSPSVAEARWIKDPLAIGEGIETTLTVACARPDYRCWAAGSLDLMGLLDWPACASAVILLRDNDLGAQAGEAFARVERHWRGMSAGRPVVVVRASSGNDFNDQVRATA